MLLLKHLLDVLKFIKLTNYYSFAYIEFRANITIRISGCKTN